MTYKVNVAGFMDQNIEVDYSVWKGAKLLVNREPAPKGNKRGEMLLTRDDGEQVVATWKPQLYGFDVPQLSVDGETIKLVEPLRWYQWVWGGLPILLIFIGGALGGFTGAIAFLINIKVFRSEMGAVWKYVLTGAISVLAVITYLVVATVISLLI